MSWSLWLSRLNPSCVSCCLGADFKTQIYLIMNTSIQLMSVWIKCSFSCILNTHACVCICLHMHAHMHALAHTHTHTYTLACMHAHTDACMHSCACACVRAHACARAHTHTHTHTHTNTHLSNTNRLLSWTCAVLDDLLPLCSPYKAPSDVTQCHFMEAVYTNIRIFAHVIYCWCILLAGCLGSSKE